MHQSGPKTILNPKQPQICNHLDGSLTLVYKLDPGPDSHLHLCRSQISSVGLKKYASVSPSAFGLGGKNRIAVIRASGAIVSGGGGGGLMTGSNISADGVIKQLRAIGKQKVGTVPRLPCVASRESKPQLTEDLHRCCAVILPMTCCHAYAFLQRSPL